MVIHSDNIGIIWLNTTMGLVNPPEWKMLHKIWNSIFDIIMMRYIRDKHALSDWQFLLLAKVVLNDTCTFENMNRTNTQLNTHNVVQKMSLLELIRLEIFLKELSSLGLVFFIKMDDPSILKLHQFFYIVGSLG